MTLRQHLQVRKSRFESAYIKYKKRVIIHVEDILTLYVFHFTHEQF